MLNNQFFPCINSLYSNWYFWNCLLELVALVQGCFFYRVACFLDYPATFFVHWSFLSVALDVWPHLWVIFAAHHTRFDFTIQLFYVICIWIILTLLECPHHQSCILIIDIVVIRPNHRNWYIILNNFLGHQSVTFMLNYQTLRVK